MYSITNNYDKTSLKLGFVLGKGHQGDRPQIRGQQMRQALHVLGLFRQRAVELALATLLLLQINLAGLHAVLKVLQCSGELGETLQLQHVAVAVQAQRNQARKHRMLEPESNWMGYCLIV